MQMRSQEVVGRLYSSLSLLAPLLLLLMTLRLTVRSSLVCGTSGV